MSAPDIFLSYTREDQAAAQRFTAGFEAQGFSVWWDATLRSGEAYDQVTEEALRTAKAVVVLWSTRSVESRWVRAEATLADRNRTLVPARIEACDLPIMFELTQTADLSRWNGDAQEPAWRAFLADVRRFVDAGASPKRAEASISLTSYSPRRGKGPSIAVLPFINRSGREEDEVFADGMVEDLTAALSVSRRMKVIASSATATYRKGARDLREIGRDLGVRYLLEGNLRRAGDDLRVTAQLVEAEDGDILWTQKFDRPLAELSGLQEALVTEVAAYLGVEVERAEMQQALRKPGDLTAWQAVLRAEAHVSRQTVSGYEAAIAEAKRAIAIDPDYDLAYATLAMALGVVCSLRGSDDPQLVQEVLDAVARARAFDSSDPVVLARIAISLHCIGRNRDALPFAQRAVSTNPNLEVPHIALSNILVMLGRWEEATAESEAALRLAPNSVWLPASLYSQSLAHFRAGRFDQSLRITEQSLRLCSGVLAQIHKVICLAKLDRWDEARDAMRGFRESNAELSLPKMEKDAWISVYREMPSVSVEEIIAILRKLWGEGPDECPRQSG
jgi:TolB-like protein